MRSNQKPKGWDMGHLLWKKANGAPVFVLVLTEGFFPQVFSSFLSSSQEMVFSVNDVLFSAQPRANGKMHIWLINHNQAWVPCLFFIGWLSFVLNTFSVWIMGHPDGNLQWPLNSHLGGPLNPLWNVMFATWSVFSVVPKKNHSFLSFHLFIFPV